MSITELKVEKSEFIANLSILVNELFDLSMDSTLISEEGLTKEEYRSQLFAMQDLIDNKATKLKKQLDLIFYRDFRKRTKEFDTARKALKLVSDGIQDELASLEKLVRRMKQFNKFLELVDEAILIAAGLAKSL